MQGGVAWKARNVSARDIWNRVAAHVDQHGVLGILANHHEVYAWLAVSTLLLGLCYRHGFIEFSTRNNFGSAKGGPSSFINNLQRADGPHLLWAFLAGILFNLANLLLVAAVEYAGLSVAFPVGVGFALVEGALMNYFTAPKGNPILLFGGMLWL